MKMTIEVPDEWGNKLDELAKQDGHSNRTAVVRKIVNLFFTEKLAFSCHKTTKQPPKTESKQ